MILNRLISLLRWFQWNATGFLIRELKKFFFDGLSPTSPETPTPAPKFVDYFFTVPIIAYIMKWMVDLVKVKQMWTLDFARNPSCLVD